MPNAEEHASDELHEKLSSLLTAPAVFPPRPEDEGFGLFDIVVVDPYGGNSKMLIPTGINLKRFLSPEQIERLKEEKRSRPRKTLSTTNAGWINASSHLRAALARAGVGAESSVDRLTEIIVEDEKSKFLRITSEEIQNIVSDKFAEIILSLEARVRSKFIFGIIWKVVTANVYAAVKAAANGDLNLEAGTVVGDDLGIQATGGRGELSYLKLNSDGVIGVNLFCFVVKVDRKTSSMQHSSVISVVRPNENDLNQARAFVIGSRNPIRTLVIHRKSRYLFSSAEIKSPDDESVEKDKRDALRKVIASCGNRPAMMDGHESDESDLEDLETKSEFAGMKAHMLLPRDPSKENRPKLLIVADIATLAEASQDEDLRWLPAVPLRSTSVLESLCDSE